MPTKRKSPVLPMERGANSEHGVPDWEDARVFLEVTRHKSFRAAAQTLKQSVNALRRHIDRLESNFGAALITRHVDGIKLTSEGEQVLRAVERMEEASFDVVRANKVGAAALSGSVKLAITEGLGTFWIAPKLGEIRRIHPRLVVDIQCAMSVADVYRLEADVAVQIVPPKVKDARIVKLGRMHGMPFVSRGYHEAHDMPKNVKDLGQHPILMQVSDQVLGNEVYEHFFKGEPKIGRVSVITNTSSAHYTALASGAGIGLLPTYVYAIGAPVVPLDVDLRVQNDIWLVYHPDAKRIARVRFLIDWLVEAFSPQRYPWFADTFIHPKDLPQNSEVFCADPSTKHDLK